MRIVGMSYAGLFNSIDMFHIKMQLCPMIVSNPQSSMRPCMSQTIGDRMQSDST